MLDAVFIFKIWPLNKAQKFTPEYDKNLKNEFFFWMADFEPPNADSVI